MKNINSVTTTDEDLANCGIPPALQYLLSYFIDIDHMEEFIKVLVESIDYNIPVEFIELVEDLCSACKDIIEEALDCSDCNEDTAE